MRCSALSRVLKCGCVVLCAVLAYPLYALEPQDTAQRPKIGLALSGGGARGAAHVGVLKVLEEMQIPIDYVAGTSMGSIVGGLYASGMTPEEIESALANMDWDHIFSDKPLRQDRSFRRKRDDDLYLVKAKPGITDEGELKFPTGAIQGQKFLLAMRELTLPLSAVRDFDQLPIPFRALATDIGDGSSVVLKSGDLATAMRASMAVPVAFAATRIDGRLLVDGGITNNLPIDIARSMGADIVIAIDISTPHAPAEEVDNLLKITGQLTSIMTRSNVERQIATLADRDILIVPPLGDLSSADFDRSADAIAIGREAALAQRGELARLSVPDDTYRQLLAARSTRPSSSPPVVDFVRIENNSTVEDAMIRDRLRQTIGEPLDRQQLESDIGRIYGLELFEAVSYQVIEERGETGLLVSARARSWGPNYLQFGLEMSADMDGDDKYNLGFGYLRTGINALNGEIRLAAQLGSEPLIVGELYQPLDTLSRYFVNPKIGYGARNVNVFDGDDQLAEFRVREAQLDLALGREFSVYGEGRLGYRFRTGDVKLRTGTPGWEEVDYDTGSAYLRLAVDRLDNYNFPERGGLALLQYELAREGLGGDSDFDQIQAIGNSFTNFGNGHVVGLGGRISTTHNGSAAIQNRYRLGGFLNLSGHVEDSLSGQQAAAVTALYYRSFKPLSFLSWYIGGSLEYGGVWEESDDIFSDGIAAGSIFLGADTPIGPAYFGYGHAEGGQNAVFFYLGRPQFRR